MPKIKGLLASRRRSAGLIFATWRLLKLTFSRASSTVAHDRFSALRPFPVLQRRRARQRVFAHFSGHSFLRGERADRTGAGGAHSRIQLSGSGAPNSHLETAATRLLR